MAGETQHTYAVKKLDAEFKLQDEGTALEQYSSSEKATKESSEHFSSSDVEERTISRGAKFVDKDRDYTQQREAVIRPQQAGKIDFKSLQNKPKFASNRTWPGGKGSPQSPSGKNRNRDKGKRSGKSERGNPQQLYRLSITNPRSNPTIGIAYPQQKVSPPKKLEASRGPVSGSYRFHVPSIPEREAELQQEELNYSRCFQETSSNLTSPSYTSQALGTTGGSSTHQQPPQQQQQPGPMENNNNTQPSGQLLFPEFQLSGSNDWQSPERTFNGSNYGISSQKSTVLSEVNKANGSFLPFQYGYLLLEDSNPDPFPCDQNPQSQDYIDSSLTPAQVTLNSFTFQTSGEGQEGVQNNTQFNSDQRQDRSSYPHPPQPPQYLQAPQGAASSMHCTRGLSEDSASSESSGSISQQSDQGKSSLPDSTDTFVQADNRDVALTSGSKRSCHPKDSAASQRTHIQASVHHARNIAQGPNSQMHFSNKAYNSSPPLNSIHMSSVPFDKSVKPKPHIHNPASSSTCSSLSPASTSPVNLSEDSQLSKTGHPPPFYHQHQLKAQGPTDHLSTNSHHFHSDASRNLPYAPEREKDDMMNYLQNNEHQKPSMEGNKGYMEGFGVEHHPPPPPYSAHQLLATSLATANLDQLDVLLTCKQCDQNFTNLASFLGHKQYCGQHAFSQKVDDTRTTPGSSTQFHNDMTKDPSSGTSLCQRVSMPRCPTDLHLSLLGLNKNGELMSDSETKGDSKDDPMKLNLFTGAGNIPVALPDLEMEDAKLDSLITEALNGLGYQSDNAEIDSSFIDAFTDDDPATVKVSSNRQTLKTKDSMVFEGKIKQSTENDRSLTQGKYLYDSDKASLQTENNHTVSKLEKTTLNFEQDEKINIKKELSHINSRIASGEKPREQENKVKDIRKLCKSEKENTNTPRFLLSSTFSERCGVRSLRDSSLLSGSTSSQVSSANRSSPTQRTTARENKRKRTGAGTWSKELIHKIVQQKNKLHKLHVKGTKNLQFSLVMERLTPTVPNPTFGEYDYVSDSDDESEPVKTASQGRLSQSSRCKYTYTKECKWRARSDRDSAAWRHESKECFEVKKAEDVSLSLEKPGSHQRLGRRGSRSSTSSEVSTSVSISSDGINSPKSTDRTDSDCEKRVEIKRKDSSEQRTYERSSQKLCKESSTQLALTFTKSTQSALMDEVCLSPIELQEPLTQKDTSDLIPYPLEQDQSLMKSPLSFDTSSMFGDLSVAGFENGLYTDIPLHKEGFNSLNTTNDKKEVFSASSFLSPFLDQRDWGLMVDVSPMLPDDISQYKDGSDKLNEKKSDYNHVPLSLPDKIIDYSTNLNSCASEDELEIKRIVTELENQLQTAKLSPPLLTEESPKQLKMSKFSPLRLDDESENEDTGLDMGCPVQSMALAVSIMPSDPHSESFAEHSLPWSSPFEFELMEGQHTPTHDEPIVLEQFSKKDDREHSMTTTTSNTEKVKEQLKQEDHRDEDMDVDKRTDIEKSEEILESKTYAENLMKSLEVISDSIFKNDPITPEEEEPNLTSRKSPAHLHSESQTPSADAAEGGDHDEMVIPDDVNIKSTHFRSQPPLSKKTELPSDVIKEIVSLQPTESLPNDDSGSEFKDIPIMSNVTEDNSVIETDYCSNTEMDNQPMAEETYENQKLEDYGDEILEAKSALPDHTERLDTTIDEHTELLKTSIDEHTELLDTTVDEHTKLLDTSIDEHTELLDTTVDEHTELLDTTIDEHPGLLNTSIDEHTELLDTSTDEHTELLDTTIDVQAELLDSTIVEHTELLDTSIDEHQEPVEDISLNAKSVSQPSNGSNRADQEMDVNLDNKPEEVENASEEQSIYVQSHCKSVCSSPSANEQTEDSSTCVMKEDNIDSKSTIQNQVISHTVSLRCSSPMNDNTNQSTHVFMETVAVKPCSPLLMETNTEHPSHTSPFSNIDSDDESTMLVIAECDSDLDSDAHMEHTPEDKETEMKPGCEANHRQRETIPEVENIQEQVPLHLMASPQHSPCKEDLQMDERLDIIPEDAPPSSPVLPASPHTPVDNSNTQEQEHPQPITCNNIDTIPASIQSPKEENCNDINAKEALHIDDSLTRRAEMEYSLVSPPQLDLGITDSKICSTDACIPSPLPLTIATEESEAMEALTKRVSVSLYDFKLSPLNYNYIPDEPPQLSQFDYTPISPANVDEEEPAFKQSPKDDCEPCDRSDDATLTSDKRLCDIETEVPMSPDHTAKLSPPDESLNKSNIQNDIKCPSILLGLPSQSTAPSTGDLDICPAPLQTIDYLDLHVDLLKRVDPEALDMYKVPSELNTLAFIKDISDNQHTPKPLIICENEPTSLPSDQTESLTVEEGQCSVTHQQEEETTQKKIHLCEICSMCFRTVPGLKRHKAMKHLIRTERSPILENANHQGSLHSYQTSQSIETGNKKDLELLVPHTCLQTESNEASENHCPVTSNSSFVTKQGETNFILENIASETNMAVPADDIVHQMPPQFTKAKKIYKTRKNRNKEVNVKPDPFSDELLNILKTDILQAITPEFQTQVKQGCCKSPEKQDIIHYLVNHKVTEQEEVPFTVTSNSGIEQMPMSPMELTNLAMVLTQSNNDTEEVKSTNLPEIINGVAEVSMGVSVSKDISREYDMSRENLHDTKEACEQQTKDESNAKEILGEVAVKIECEKNSGPTDEVDNISCFKSSLASPPRLSADLNAFLDESTFSQLFPTRNEELKRKKFAKVYGKKNKKQKLSTDSPLVQDHPPPDLYLKKKDDDTENQIDQTFVSNQNDPCEYETISIDDAIMLNMCHNSTLKSDSKKVCTMKGDTTDHKDNHENGVDHGSDFLCQPESTIDKASLAWSAFNDSVTDTVISSDQNPCKAEAPIPPCPLPIIASSAPYPGEPFATDNVSPFHSIDIPNLNTTFQLPEIQLFDSNKDIPLERPIVTDYAETRDTAKAKKLTEHRGRKRQEGSVKIKDKQYKCKVCFTWFLTLGELNFHKLSHNPSPPPTCYMCVQRKFSSREQLRDHLREKHAKNKAGIWTCGMCLKEISDVWMYNEHLREHATQFARKGQSHSAILGSLPGSGMQESAVKNFITSIMQRRPSKASRDTSKVSNKEKLAVVENTEQVKTTEVGQPKVVKPKGNSEKVGKPSALTPVEVLHNTEPVPKNVEMHPNCKDPSRDCHHCGKQFPKPFKLQRHLVVHNLNKIFLCHKCPVTYQEPQELKYHLKNEHEEVDELDSKHTTLYTCELCADVMHVIKKSFICSTCNYTFSKKEQFDRHMEKHLSGGNKIFKFRGVLRPIKTSPSKENDECELPANKKRKILTDILQENSSDSGIASIASLHLHKSAEMPVLKLSVHTTEDFTQTSAGEYHTENYASVKTEDMAEEYSDMLVELEHCTFHLGSEGLSTATPKTEDIDPSPSPKLPVRDIGEADGKSFTEPCDVKEEHDPLASSIAEKEKECFANAKQSTPVSSIQTTTAEAEKKTQRTDSMASDEELYVSFRENLINSSMTPDTHDIHRPPTKHKSSTVVMDQMREGDLGQQTTSRHSHDNKQNDKTSTPKPSENTKHSSNNSPRAMESTPVHHTKITSQGPASNEDKDSVRREQKKRKEMRTPHSLQRVSSSATRENLAADVKTKNKLRPSKCESPAVPRKSDSPSEYPVLSSVRDDVVSNKIVSKHKTSGSLGLQAKRSSLDNCTPRKAEMAHHINGDYKSKKGPLGRPLHYPVSKVSALPMNNSLNKSRPKTGVRSMESHSYRTAESQNNLLSQLFGQKLTSFKIPLRKDTSEPIN
ncbi:zinc finger protein 469 [Oncorhynchus masou masou]|uniref:zinc finger protein 469 n=1 Tax=Oncorhynchus masou masou TaxID=90313 RepID=UPI003183124C